MIAKPKLAVYKFSSCDGCQLSILNLEDELLELADSVEIAYFLEARRKIQPGPYDIGLIEGSITTPHEIERIHQARKDCRVIIALGTCATAGGVQALRNFTDVEKLAESVYAHPEYLDTLANSTPISDHITVDFELWGCPVNKFQSLEVLSALLHQRKPRLPEHSVCLDCKQHGTTCVTVANGTPCLGPITRSGCGALCPGFGRGCYGCFGPAPHAQLDAFVPLLVEHQRYEGEAVRLLRTISGSAPLFREAAQQVQRLEADHA